MTDQIRNQVKNYLENRTRKSPSDTHEKQKMAAEFPGEKKTRKNGAKVSGRGGGRGA